MGDVRHLSKPTMLGLVVVASLGLTGASQSGDSLAARASADVVLVREGETVNEDLYAGANIVTIEGVIEGDLVVWAFERLEVTGEIRGDIIGYATNARINGQVDGAVRLIGADLSVAGQIGADLMVIGWAVTADASIGRDVLAWSRSLRVNGSVGRDIEGQTFGPATIGAEVGRDVEMSVNRMRVTADASIIQDLAYRSARSANIDEGASVGGTVIQRSPLEPNLRVRAVRSVGFALALLAFLWLGLLAIWVMPSGMRLAIESVRNDLARSAYVGAVVALTPFVLLGAVVVIAVLVPPELALTILAVAAPFWVAVAAILMIAVIVAPVPVAIVIGHRIIGQGRSAFGAYVVGAILLLATLIIPIVAFVVFLVVGVIGLGALVRGALRSRGSLGWAIARPDLNLGRRRASPEREAEPEMVQATEDVGEEGDPGSDECPES